MCPRMADGGSNELLGDAGAAQPAYDEEAGDGLDAFI